MAYNIPENYKNQTPAPAIDKKTLNKMAWRSLFLQASFNYARMQSCGWLYAMLPGLRKIHTDEEDLAASMSHNLEFFNTHPFLVTFVMGIILSLEQNKTDIATIRAVRVAAMGPLGGIGDALFWFTLVPITAGITSNMAINGSLAAPFIFLLVFNIAQFAIRYILMHWSYKLGTEAISILTKNAKEFTRAASLLGIFVVGALTCVYGVTTLNVKINNGETNTVVNNKTVIDKNELDAYKDMLYVKDKDGKITDELQEKASVVEMGNGKVEIAYNRPAVEKVDIDIQKILDGILPKLLPLALTLILYFLLAKRKWSPLACIGLLLLIGLLGSGFGIWTCIWP